MNEIEKEHFFDEAINSTVAGDWELFLARIFGKKYVGTDEYGITVKLTKWRGKLYLIGVTDEHLHKERCQGD